MVQRQRAGPALHRARRRCRTCSTPPSEEPRRVADLVNISSVAGGSRGSGSGVYNATKHGVGAFSESLRQEVTQRHVRVALVEPGAVATELAGHNRPEVLEGIRRRFAELRADAGRRHRGRHRLHGHPPAAHGRQRDADPADRPGPVAVTFLSERCPRVALGVTEAPSRTRTEDT